MEHNHCENEANDHMIKTIVAACCENCFGKKMQNANGGVLK